MIEFDSYVVANHILQCVRILALFRTVSASVIFSNDTLELQNPVRHALLFVFCMPLFQLFFAARSQLKPFPSCLHLREGIGQRSATCSSKGQGR